MSPTPAARVTLVAAVADNGVIGDAGAIPWRIPEDFAHFRSLTWGNTLVMDRETAAGTDDSRPDP
jgi:dihydrofolate reductase